MNADCGNFPSKKNPMRPVVATGRIGAVSCLHSRARLSFGWKHVGGSAAKGARRHFVACDAHVPGGGFLRDGKLLLDFHAFPLRIEEVADKPCEASMGKFWVRGWDEAACFSQ